MGLGWLDVVVTLRSCLTQMNVLRNLKCTHTSYLSSCLIVMSSAYLVAQQCPWDQPKLEGAIWDVAPAKTITTTTTTTTCEPEVVQE